MHEGHRERLKNRYLNEGIDAFEQHQILEFLLFYAIPRRDTNELAHRLLNKFGSIAGVFEADPHELVKVDGVGMNTAILLTVIPQLSRVYLKNKWGDKPLLDGSSVAGEFCKSLFSGRTYEAFYVICLDSQNRVNYSDMIHEGTINEAYVYPRIVVETALRHKASSVILSHNHPGGSLEPSRADIAVTKKIQTALEPINISLVDHIIVAGTKYTSFAERGII